MKTGSADELEKLFFPISVTVGSGIDEENQIKAWLDRSLCRRKISLTWRFARFLSTAFPNFLDKPTPSLVLSKEFDKTASFAP